MHRASGEDTTRIFNQKCRGRVCLRAHSRKTRPCRQHSHPTRPCGGQRAVSLTRSPRPRRTRAATLRTTKVKKGLSCIVLRHLCLGLARFSPLQPVGVGSSTSPLSLIEMNPSTQSLAEEPGYAADGPSAPTCLPATARWLIFSLK